MSEIPRVSGREVVKALAKIGYQQDRQRGSHIILRQTASPHRRVTFQTIKKLPRNLASDLACNWINR